MSRPHRIYGFDLSYFTRKMEAAFELHAADFRRRSKTVFNGFLLERRSGTRKVPVVLTPDGLVLTDTTPIIDRLDGERPARRLFPEGLDGVQVRLVEEWLDEWFPRTVIHYRWHDEEARAFASGALAREATPFLPGPWRRRLARRIGGWGARACRAVGVDDPSQQESVEREASAVWRALEAQLGCTRYAMGDRATAVDAVLIGALRGHYLVDPAARRVVDGLPRVLAWVSGAADWDGAGGLPRFPECTEFGRTVLDRMGGPYRSWLQAHAAAVERGARTFSTDIEGCRVEFRVLHSPSPTDSANYLCARIADQIRGVDRDRLEAWLIEHGLDDVVRL